MTDITLKNFRCFGNEQTVPLAPLTLLVGDNSTGKTSFMAMVRVLWDLAFNGDEPNFKKLPYDLGSFIETVCDNPDATKRADFFGASCSLGFQFGGGQTGFPDQIDVEFKDDGSIPILSTIRISQGDYWIKCITRPDLASYEANASCGVSERIWEVKLPEKRFTISDHREEGLLTYFREIGQRLRWNLSSKSADQRHLIARTGAGVLSPVELRRLQRLCRSTVFRPSIYGEAHASAAVQSSPQRTYEVSQSIRDIAGRHVPKYLAYLSYRDEDEWLHIKGNLERFGRNSGLFDRIHIRKLGTRGGDPFQIEIGLSDNGAVTPNRNLIDVGYGVSQLLPILTEILRRDARHLLLFQQPEIHLHPSAQAALGSLFCQAAGEHRQIIVETHSDYILDRIRMDIRDQECKLQHQDVAILFFERSGSSVNIHPLRLDTGGNLLDAPPSYRQFFLREIDRLFRC